MKILLLIILIMHVGISCAKPYYLIIHGTWCRPFDWHMPGGDFYDALSQIADPSSVSFFIWSASNSHKARLQAAEQLVNYIELSVPKDYELNIIAHSHGCNVGFLASQIMAKNSNNSYRIHNFYALGAPINVESYMPDMMVIKFVYNLFSFNDFVQPIFGLFEREFEYHPRITNLVVLLNGNEPSHMELHNPLIARWIPHVPALIKQNRMNYIHKCMPQEPGMIHFWSDKKPIYSIDRDRANRRKRDIRILSHLTSILRNTKEIEFQND